MKQSRSRRKPLTKPKKARGVPLSQPKLTVVKREQPAPDAMPGDGGQAPPFVVGGSLASSPDPNQPRDRLILRAEAARIVGISVPTLRRYERSVLKPMLVDEHNVHWHSLRACEQLKKELTPNDVECTDRINGVISAAAFELFDAGANAADVVKGLKILAADARILQKEWADLRGVMLISGETLLKIRSLRTTDSNKIFTGEELLLYLNQAEYPVCRGCSSGRQPILCLTCYYRRPPQAEELVARALQKIEERRAASDGESIERETYEQARERVSYDPAKAATARAEREARIAARRAAQQPIANRERSPAASHGANARDTASTAQPAASDGQPPGDVPDSAGEASASRVDESRTAAPKTDKSDEENHDNRS